MSIDRPRWAIFSWSIVSDIDNADAHLLRALGNELATLGHEAIFYEERANPAIRALIKQSGARALDDFRARYPQIDYRTLEPRAGADLVDWLGRALATADIALITRDTPASITAQIGRMTRHHLQTYLLDTGLGAAFSEMAVESLQLANFSGVLVDTEERAQRYQRFVEPARVHVFGAMPSTIQLTENLAEAELAETAARLVTQVQDIAKRDRASMRATVQPNGQPEHK